MNDKKKQQAFDAILNAVAEQGWGQGVVQDALLQAGFKDGDAGILFPEGVKGTIEYYVTHTNEAMVARLKKKNLSDMGLREKVKTAILLRLAVLAEHKAAVRRTLHYFLNPLHACEGVASAWNTADAIWKAIGHHPTDFSYYSKRATLASIYSATLLYWLGNSNPDEVEVGAFIDRRLGELMQLGKVIRRQQ